MNNETEPRIMIRYVYFRINKLLQATREKERQKSAHKSQEDDTKNTKKILFLKFYSD